MKFLPAGYIDGVFSLLWKKKTTNFLLTTNQPPEFMMYVYYLIFDVCSATGSQQDPRQLPSPHGGGDVQRRVSVLSRTDTS